MLFSLYYIVLFFTGMVRFAVRGGAIDGLYFYPKPVQERAIEIGLTTKETVIKKKKAFYDVILHRDAGHSFVDYRTLEWSYGF